MYLCYILLQLKHLVISNRSHNCMDSPIKQRAPLLTITEAATFLNVSKATIRRWTDDGRLACSRIGSRNERRFIQADLAQLITKSESTSGPKPLSAVPPSETKQNHSSTVPESNSGHHCIVSDTIEEEWASLAPAILKALDEGAQVLIVDVLERHKTAGRFAKGERDQHAKVIGLPYPAVCIG